ncbi:extracellular catalytic domain type 1 short-chain-length polyhydroxyalkanoate depolymerase [Rhizobium azibense]|uniref:Poly(Hydroxyalkanoate) depolymerase family esterase n=1 Tax=Rhizobium azibense TaxID=1136135 RepID=A0A4R3S2A1_9HYPH|nr:PHB depolymerase family esterase [Rhizobium azibense]TCU41287.1 poly(hydroxyalkanoate) depolymerase family esterase [Rhizobium azibense]
MSFRDSPDERLVEIASFGSNPGALKAWLFLPTDMDERAPLVVALHGCTQTAKGYALGSGWSQLAERRGFAVLYPEQQHSNNPNLCFNWFEPADARRGAGEAASISQMVAHVVQSQGIDQNRIFVTGLSAGGAMANAMLSTYPEIFAGGAIIAGLPYGVAANVAEAFAQMQGRNTSNAPKLRSALRRAGHHAGPWPTVSVWHGTHDQTVRPRNADQIVDQWSGVHATGKEPDRMEVANGHQHKVWLDADGRMVIETYSIKGMAHGLPLATQGDTSFGRAGPYMLEAGISSTARIARSWGLAFDSDVEATEFVAAEVSGELKLAGNGKRRSPRAGPGDNRVGKIINDALRAAGLLR